MPRKPKNQQFNATFDPFADPPAPTTKRRGRPSNLEQPGKPINKGTKGIKKTQTNSNPGTLSAYKETNNLDSLISNDFLENIEEIVKGLESKEKLTIKELKFIEYHIVRGFPVQKSMILAGYQANSEGMYHYHAKKIVRKYEEHEEDRRKIQRALGYGEVFVIQEMGKLAKNATSELAKARAIASLGVWLGMDKESLQGNQGITVIIQGYDGAQQQVNVGFPPAPSPLELGGFNHPQPSQPGQPIMITR